MEQQAIPLDKLGIPRELARYVDAASPKEVKLLAARGVLPAPPKVLMAIQYCLLADPDPEVADAARQGLMGYPASVLEGAIDDHTHPKILEFFALHRAKDERIAELILLKRQTNDKTMFYLAEHVGARQVDLIANNQQRLLITPAIYHHLKKNPNASRATLDRVEAFLRIYHALDLEPGEDKAAPPTPPPAAEAPVPPPAQEAPPEEDDYEFEHGFEDEEEDFPDEWLDEEEENKTQQEKRDLWSRIAKMTVAQKIKLAYLGNANVRAILIRDTNKVVASAVLKSPAITDSEILAIANNRNVCDDVLREIARNKEWFRMYAVKLALVNNPKTPAAVSVPIVSQLMLHDLKRLAGNRNVPSVITTTARQLLRRKSHNN